MLEEVTPLLLTFNEAPNINRTLQRLTWAQTIVVVDSYSTDETLEIIRSYPQVQIFHRKFDTHTHQWNYALQQVKSEWVLSLDADYLLTDDFVSEVDALPKDVLADGYLVRFKYCVFGKPLSSTLLPPREVLFRRKKAVYVDDGHTQLLHVQGESRMLNSYIYHDDRKKLSHWIWAQDRYMMIEARKLLTAPASELSFSDRLRQKKIFAPFAILIYCLIINRGILDGWPGWYYAFQRTLAEMLLSIHLMEAEKLHQGSYQE